MFLFDLDSTLSKVEILPFIAKEIGMEHEMARMTELCMAGKISFRDSFLQRVNLLKKVRVSRIRQLVAQIALNDRMVDFIMEYQNRCYIVTGNLDVWIGELMEQIKMSNRYFSSRAHVEEDYLSHVVTVADKGLIARQFVSPFVAIGDGDNDVGMCKLANISVAYGGVRKISPVLASIVNRSFFNEQECVNFLYELV